MLREQEQGNGDGGTSTSWGKPAKPPIARCERRFHTPFVWWTIRCECAGTGWLLLRSAHAVHMLHWTNLFVTPLTQEKGPLDPRRRVHGERPVRARRLRHGRGGFATTNRRTQRSGVPHMCTCKAPRACPAANQQTVQRCAAPVGVPCLRHASAGRQNRTQACPPAQTLPQPATMRACASRSAKKARHAMPNIHQRLTSASCPLSCSL